MKFFQILTLLSLPVVMLTSCGNDDDNPSGNSFSLPVDAAGNTILSQNISTGAVEALPGANYGLKGDLDNGVLTLTINDLQYDSQKNAISFTLPAARLSITQGSFSVDQAGDVSVALSNGAVTVSDLLIKFALQTNGTQKLVQLSYTIDHTYKITTVFNSNIFVGTTTTTDLTSPETKPFTSQEPMYNVVLDRKNKTAQLQIAYAKFLPAMPSLGVMYFDKIPVEYTADGFTFSINEVVPSINNTPYPDFKVANVSGTVVAGKTLKLTFECARFNRKVSFEGTAY